ncbi:MAG: PDZ domain-containing protein [Planctomycetales bacterium]|nr:PDZ domain-containing protein [Planctomycetales bacterium]
MKRLTFQWDALLIASIVIIAGYCAQAQQVALAQDDTPPEGKIVRISPDPEDVASEEAAIEPDTTVAEEPTYWIGISGRPVENEVLRTHLQLAEDMGVVIEHVVPDSPADKAGLRKHDIILRANGAGVHGMQVLQDHVRAHQAEPIELLLIRLGKEETVVVVPAERPAEFSNRDTVPRQEQWNGLGARPDALGRLMEQFQLEGGLPGGIRRFGPGIFLHGQPLNLNSLPNGVSVSIQRENDGPAKITVQQGDKTWQIVGDDPESLEQLPEDLRPFVQRMLQGNAAPQNNLGFDWEAELENFLPEGFGELQRRRDRRAAPSPAEQEIQERMERMERELQELQKRLSEE